MNLAGRIKSLERRRSGKNCPICFGQGRLVITCNTSYGEPSNPPLAGCEWCGEIMHIQIVEMSEGAVWNRHRERMEGQEP